MIDSTTASPAIIQKLRPDQPIVVYLLVSEEGGSATLVQEVENGEGRTPSVLCQSDAPHERDEVADDREGGTRPSPNG